MSRSWLLALACAAIGCTSVARAPSSRTPAPDAAMAPNSAGEEIVARTNAERRKLGLPAFAQNAALMRAAQLQANQMAALNRMAHELPGAAYPTMDARLDAVGYRPAARGENVAEGYPSPAAVVSGWMTSQGHRENIVSPHFTEMGAGAASSRSGRKYYAQVFGGPR